MYRKRWVMKTRVRLSGIPLWRAEHKVQSLFGRGISHPSTPREGTRPTAGRRACRPRALTRRTVGASIGV
jgi:hypothetical protein